MHRIALASILILLLASVFDTGIKIYYLALVFYAVALAYLLKNGVFEKWLLYVAGMLIFFNGVSAASGYINFGIGPNYSWILQTLAMPLIFVAIWWVQKYYNDKLDKTLYYLFVVCLALLLLQMVVGVSTIGIPLSQMIKQDWSVTYYYAAAAYERFALMKGILPWLSLFLLIYHRDRFRNFTFSLLIIGVVLLTVMTGARSALLGIVGVLIVMLLMKKRGSSLRLAAFVSIIAAVSIFVMANIAEFERYTNHSGRYYVPILTSTDFWGNPFGVGRGNYVEAAEKNLYEVNVGYVNPSYMRNKGLGENQLHSVAESDLLLLAVELGWLFYAVYLLFFGWTVISLITKGKRWSERKRTGAYLLVYLFAAGISQDFWNNPISWVLYPLVFGMILSSRPGFVSPVQQLTLRSA